MISAKGMTEFKKELYEFYDTMDPTGMNTEFLKNHFDKMDRKEFNKYFDSFFKNEKARLMYHVKPYYNDLTMDAIRATSKKYNIPLFERVSIPKEHPDDPTYWTTQKVPILIVQGKRVEQMASKKNTMSISTAKRNAMSGQVTGADKNSRMSDMENISLVALAENKNILKEFLGCSADDPVMEREANRQASTYGFIDLDKIPSSPFNKTALNTTDVFYIAAGIKTDLVTPGLLLKRTIQKMDRTNVTNSTAKKN